MLTHRNFTGNLKVKAGFFSFFILDDLTNAVCKCKEKLIFCLIIRLLCNQERSGWGILKNRGGYERRKRDGWKNKRTV